MASPDRFRRRPRSQSYELGAVPQARKDRGDNTLIKFSPTLWARWRARDQPSEGDERRAAGIAEFRALLNR